MSNGKIDENVRETTPAVAGAATTAVTAPTTAAAVGAAVAAIQQPSEGGMLLTLDAMLTQEFHV